MFNVGEPVHFRVAGKIRLGVITGRRLVHRSFLNEEVYQYWIQCGAMEYNKWEYDIMSFPTHRHVEELVKL